MTVDITFNHLIAISAIGFPTLFGCIWLFLKSNKDNFTKLTDNINVYHMKNDETTDELSKGQRSIEKNYLDRFKETNENITDTKDTLLDKIENISDNLNLLVGEHKAMVCLYQKSKGK